MSLEPICSTCETDKYLKLKSVTHKFEVRGKRIPYTYKILGCKNCGELVSTPEQNDEILKGVYDTYKAKHGLLRTDEIIEIRKYYNLSLRDFSKILGLSYITYHRYEKGAIPDTALNNLLLLVKNSPENLYNLFEEVKNEFSESHQKKIVAELKMLNDSYQKEQCENCYYKIIEELNYFEEEQNQELKMSPDIPTGKYKDVEQQVEN